ncbi:MAG TPA: HAD family hydrolase [Polyangiales bacterium]|nr:HAD family hydrolase [Polyangiales bacterium]
MTTRGLLLDLDDTLYDYAPAERRGRDAALLRVVQDTGLEHSHAARLYDEARARVKGRVAKRGSSHSRLLYLHELAHASGKSGVLARVRSWERAFWTEYLRGAELRPFARELLSGWRARGHKVAIVTDLVLEVQLWKLEVLELGELVDALVVSEEVAFDKPALAAFELAIQRLGVVREQCVVVGDGLQTDGAAAGALGVPFYRVRGSEPGEGDGMTLEEVARELGVVP